jgi:hypothetical protein
MYMSLIQKNAQAQQAWKERKQYMSCLLVHISSPNYSTYFD